MKKILYLVIHCTATPEGRAVTRAQIELMHKGALKNADGSFTFLSKKYTPSELANQCLVLHTGERVNAAKTNGRGWSQVGYSDMIHLDGKVENLVPYNDNEYVEPWEITNGVAGINNCSRHVVYVGGCDANMQPKDTRTHAQKLALERYVHGVLLMHPNILIAGHYQFDKKACPSFNVPEWLRSIEVPEKNIYNKK